MIRRTLKMMELEFQKMVWETLDTQYPKQMNKLKFEEQLQLVETVAANMVLIFNQYYKQQIKEIQAQHYPLEKNMVAMKQAHSQAMELALAELHQLPLEQEILD